MRKNLNLSEMLSQLLVAFTIEHDNEWELRYWMNAENPPLRTSLVMWTNFLRFVGNDGITVGELSQKAGYPPNKVHSDLAGMLRWRYITINSVNPKRPKLNDTVRRTTQGTQSAKVWKPLVDEIENRWRLRFGTKEVARLKQALAPIIATYKRPLPHFFPTLQHTKGMQVLVPHQPECDPPEKLALPYLLSQAHHLFTLESEKNDELSLAIRANVLRVINQEPLAKKELPQLSGISKEALSMSINHLKKQGILLEESSLTGRGKAVRLTDKGFIEKQRYPEIVKTVEQMWIDKCSAKAVNELRSGLTNFIQHDEGQESPLFQGLIPHPDLWRAKVPKRTTLPHHAMILYRGGWPDGS